MSIDLSEINEEVIDSLVFSGVDFVRALTETFGADAGIKVWDSMAEAVGEDIRGRIFFSMLTGDGDGNITLLPWKEMRSVGKKIEFIKIVRAATGFGLKEAKDLSDEVENGISKRVKIPLKQKAQFVRDMKSIGAKVA